MRFFLFCAFFLTLPQFLKHEFKLPPIHAEIPSRPEWEMAPTAEIFAILNQPFTYLTHGNQSSVFLSQDGQYILKLFRYTRPRFALVQTLKNLFAKKPKDDLRTKAEKTFKAAHIACTDAKAFTQTLFAHLNLTQNQLPTVSLMSHRVPLDKYRFVLQRKVNPFKQTLLSAREHPEEMRHLIDSFISLIVRRSALGIRNSDPNLAPNFGFLNGEAVEIDFGNYRKPFSNTQRETEIGNLLNRFEHWLKKNAPEYLAFFNDLRYDLAKYESTAPLHGTERTLD